MSESSQRGTNTHLAVAQKLVELGYEVLQPFDVQLPYDLAFVEMTENGWYCPDLKKVYLVTVQSLPEASIGRLRAKKSRNNQEAGIHWAKDYEL